MTASPLVELVGVGKAYGAQRAVEDVSLCLAAREIVALLGPSGCGKTTVLRLIAGFETPDRGRVSIDGRDMAGVPAHRRPVNMMFQSYALFPHLSVADNIAFGPRRQGLSRRQVAMRTAEMLALVQLETAAAKRPHQLSGGERQRVALARAAACRPRALLLDEPLAALDRKLRDAMQFELRRIQRQLGMAFLVVTHDQEEAMGLADRVAVMAAGRIVQAGPPMQVYDRPVNRFVADFLGETNLFAGRIVASQGGWVRVACAELGGELRLPSDQMGSDCWLSIRPERLALQPVSQAAVGEAVAAQVENVVFRGAQRHCELRLATGRLVRANLAKVDGWCPRPGEPAWLAWRAEDFRLLPP